MPRRLGLRVAILLFAALLGVGTVGYMFTENWSPGQALYTTITTLTTLGIERPTSPAGQAFTAIFALVGVGTSFYILTALVVYVAEGQFGETMRRQRMERAIARLERHFIICGYGRVGREIGAELEREGVPYVLVDSNPASLADAEASSKLVIAGSPASDEVLRKARVEVARGLIAATNDDAENIYVTLTARVMQPTIFIIARANQPDAETKLQRAGANRIISPYSIGGRLMAMLAVRPLSVEFVESVLHNQGADLVLKDVLISAASPLVGLTVDEARRRHIAEATILAIKSDGRVVFNPLPEVKLRAGDTLAVVGTAAQLAALAHKT